MVEKHHHKEELYEEHHEKTSLKDTIKRLGTWKLISVGLVILLIFSVYTDGLKISFGKDKVASNVVDYLNNYLLAGQGITATSEGITEENGLYKIKLNVAGKAFDSYVTKDGNLLFPSVVDMTQKPDLISTPDQTKQKEIPKTNKPVVKAYIFSYCPYGSQFIKAMLPVYDLLKNKADIQVVAIGAMHGEFEKIESLRQICIEKNYGKDKLWVYYNKFYSDISIGNCKGDATCLSPLLEKIFSGLSMDSKKIDSCMTNDAPNIYDAQGVEASQNGITGSPTLLINDVKSQSERTPDAIKTVICSGFTTNPSECSKTLSTQVPSAGFGSTTSATSSSSSC